MNGVVEGGWSYVWAAYAVTLLVLGAYSVSVAWRLRVERDRALPRGERR